MLRIGKVKAHAASKIELARLLTAAERVLADADVTGLSSDSRLDLAYRAIMQAALAAMLANGYRPSTSEPGHHQLLIQALPKTAGIAAERVRVLDAYRAMRNQADYLGIPVSDAVAKECVVEARAVVQQVRAWLDAHRPDFS
ncbi:MAG: DNA-binding protein [Betaproteobacteria bacterium]